MASRKNLRKIKFKNIFIEGGILDFFKYENDKKLILRIALKKLIKIIL